MKNAICKKSVGENSEVTFAFGNGESVVVSPENFNPAVQAQLMAYGISQKLGDSYSGCKGNANKAHELFTDMLGRLSGDDGVWTTKRSGTGAGRQTTLIVEAVSRFKGITQQQASDAIEALDAEQLKAVRSAPQIQVLINEIKLERAKAKAWAEADAKDAEGDESNGALDLL